MYYFLVLSGIECSGCAIERSTHYIECLAMIASQKFYLLITLTFLSYN
jgi:hypothetical protein